MSKYLLASMAALGIATLPFAAPALAGETSVKTENGRTKVEAPYTRVDANSERTKVRVNAPHADVKVDTEARHVRIRVPYYSGDIRW